MVKQLTNAQVVAMAEDVEPLKAIKPGGKEHPIDRIIHDGDTVTLGGTTLVAHLTAGHTPGCTTWTTKVRDGGRDYDVVFHCSLRAQGNLTPAIVDQFTRSYRVVGRCRATVPLGDHGAQYNMQEKYARLKPGARIRSSTRRTAISKRISRKRCSRRRSLSSRQRRRSSGG
jgi:metallo-beta-lactamase class B